MRIQRKDYDLVTVFELNGDLTKNIVTQLQDTFEELFGKNRYYIVLDMENVRFIDSQSIMLLLRLNREALSYGGGIKLLRPKKVVEKFMHIGQVLELFDRYETKAEAIRSFEKNIQRQENFAKPLDPLEQTARNQRMVLLRLLEILYNKEIINMEEFNQGIKNSTHLVMDLFRNKMKS